MTSLGRNTISGELLRGFVERLENLDAERKQLADDKKVVMAEATAQGFVAAGIKYVLKVRAMKPSERQEAEAIADTYLSALGMDIETPLWRYASMMQVDIASRDSVIDAMKKFVPTNGSITIEAGGKPVRLTRGADGDVTVSEVVERPVETAASGTEPPKHQKPPVPDVTEDAAEDLGREAAKADTAIIGNPFPFGDKRRARWDLGWRKQSGNDGMGR